MNTNNLCCDVCACIYNANGEKCTKEHIKITTGNESNTAHYCADYVE